MIAQIARQVFRIVGFPIRLSFGLLGTLLFFCAALLDHDMADNIPPIWSWVWTGTGLD